MTTQTFEDAPTETDIANGLVEQIFKRHYRDIFNIIYLNIRQREDAFDITQDTFVDLLLERHKLPGIKNLSGWTFRIAMRRAANWRKRQRFLRWIPLSFLDNKPDVLWEDAEGRMIHSTIMDRVLSLLSPTYREALSLYVIAGLSIKEIAETLEIQVGAANMRVIRARLIFRTLYKEKMGYE